MYHKTNEKKQTKKQSYGKKYELTDETKIVNSVKVYRIVALRDFGEVKEGEKGGFVEKEENLSQFNNAMVYGDAMAFGDARVFDGARVYGDALVCGKARVYGNTMVYCNAMV